MPLIRDILPDGRIHWRQDPPDPDKPVVLTGPIFGIITLTDGTKYSVTPDAIEVQSQAHAGELAHKIGLLHEQNGHPFHDEDTPFVHECNEHCPEGD